MAAIRMSSSRWLACVPCTTALRMALEVCDKCSGSWIVRLKESSVSYHCLADEFDCLVGAQFQAFGAVLHPFDESWHQLWPLICRDFDGCDWCDEIGRLTWRLMIRRCKCHQGLDTVSHSLCEWSYIFLYWGFDFWIQSNPFRLVFVSSCLFLRINFSSQGSGKVLLQWVDFWALMQRIVEHVQGTIHLRFQHSIIPYIAAIAISQQVFENVIFTQCSRAAVSSCLTASSRIRWSTSLTKDITHPKSKEALPGERVLFRISVTFMFATRRLLFPRDSHTR